VIEPLQETTLVSPDGRLEIVIPAGAYASPATLSLVSRPVSDANADLAVSGNVGSSSAPVQQIFYAYEVQIGGTDGSLLVNGHDAEVLFTFDAMEGGVAKAFRNLSLVVTERVDTNADRVDDSNLILPNCDSGAHTSDGRCADPQGTDLDADGSFDALLLSLTIDRF
jgi:hypothetical protein